ncbi:MAG: type II toxin-antitoxin system VapC family toxin [Deltaproteobacteria bacterium]|nr:type II toxin-antitoxin system VapC family toxin [Deltaproteobacteria bacterium]
MRRVLDTNVALYLLGGRLAEHLPEGEYSISVITEMELLSYPDLDEAGERAIRNLLADLEIVGLTPEVKERAIGLRRSHMIKLPDAIIAATALALGAEILSCDARLGRIPGLVCRAPALKG